MNTNLGGIVGYAMRFDEKFSAENTKIKVNKKLGYN